MMIGSRIRKIFSLVDAELSQNFIDHPDDFLQSNSSTFDQACYHLDVKDSCFINSGFTNIGGLFIWTRFRQAAIAPGVQILFLYLARFAAIIFNASLYGTYFPMGLPTTKGTTEVLTVSISGMGNK
ncbi:MAG: hypothetical protein U9N62_02025 [Thermotogota bacterium]|nr:hypothetical protein [Thermotogota bacterium]